jgi:hypothetical protein
MLLRKSEKGTTGICLYAGGSERVSLSLTSKYTATAAALIGSKTVMLIFCSEQGDC